ncbi:MAG: ATP-binding cassette domain-containing protein [Candidatus Izimaplasma sp.]|nr:ATP-binding cassette domain-containing protein [Candidatus Izimaplasma bacterium]
MVLSKINAFVISYDTQTVKFDEMLLTGRVTVFAGPNGVGKSTLIRSLAGLNNVALYDGKLRYATDYPKYPIDVTVKTVIDTLIRYDNTFNLDIVYTLIEQFQFKQYLDHECASLSKGNQMKLNLILTLSCDVPLYLLDEPFSGLDDNTRNELLTYILSDNKQYILTSHLNDIIKDKRLNVVML